jgi:hypothetical protein
VSADPAARLAEAARAWQAAAKAEQDAASAKTQASDAAELAGWRLQAAADALRRALATILETAGLTADQAARAAMTLDAALLDVATPDREAAP